MKLFNDLQNLISIIGNHRSEGTLLRLKRIEQELLNNQELLYKVAARYLKNHHDILDALQETAYKAIKYSHKVKDDRFILTWIVRILINNCLQILKSSKKFPIVEITENTYSGYTDSPNPEIEINDCLLKLNKNYRDVIVMKHIEGYRISEIAQIYNKPEGTIKTWLRRGLELLKSEVIYNEE